MDSTHLKAYSGRAKDSRTGRCDPMRGSAEEDEASYSDTASTQPAVKIQNYHSLGSSTVKRERQVPLRAARDRKVKIYARGPIVYGDPHMSALNNV